MRKVRFRLLVYFARLMRIQVLYQGALVQDIERFDAGDATEIGEKGLTLRWAIDQSVPFR
jgi:hypothetical protein